MKAKKYVEAHNVYIPPTKPLDYSKFVRDLYTAQKIAVEMALRYKVSNLFGPAATAKSHTLAALLRSDRKT